VYPAPSTYADCAHGACAVRTVYGTVRARPPAGGDAGHLALSTLCVFSLK